MHEEITEATALTSGTPKPRYAFESSFTKLRKRRVRQFQCCICSIFLSIIVTVIVASVAWGINDYRPEEDTTNETLVLLQENWPLPDDSTEYQLALKAGKKALKERKDIEENAAELEPDSASYRHHMVVATTPMARKLSMVGFAEVQAARYLNDRNLSKICHKTNSIWFSDYCDIPKPECNPYKKYRSYNGSCNNLSQGYGVAYSPFRRILPPDYADGVNAPRMAKSGKDLPSARTVSLIVHRPIYNADPKFTVMLAVFGQFLDHDITATAVSQGKNGKSVSCCPVKDRRHPECFPVILENSKCMEFVRSAPGPTCCMGPREQMNQASAYIDGSVIYGSDESVANELRTFQGGELRMLVVDNRTLLPISRNLSDGCNREEENNKGRYCFLSGDARANENLHLTSMHLLWARQHNLVAGRLREVNPHWDDERVFQETRKIIGALLQHIAYNEFLAIILGDFMGKFDLEPMKDGYYFGYNASLDAGISNVFAASAFRFAHTLIPTLVKMIDGGSKAEFVELHRMLFNPFELYKREGFDKGLRGAINDSVQAVDPYFTAELKEHMFVRDGRKGSCGLDLVSLNIQRGRDHGLAGYTSWRTRCALRRPHSFHHLKGDIDDDSLGHIQFIYSDVDDIDLYTGSLSERPLENSFLGPTVTCLLLDQFVRLKRGDRFWYENPSVFTPMQLQQIRKASLARIICDNSDNVRSVQPEVMKRGTGSNKAVDCGYIDQPDFNHWKEELKKVPVGPRPVEPRRSPDEPSAVAKV
ncbi:PREDICTED: peroxidasin homolog [Nicrophorus vespilloides]|uniref:Peroxidasin homolog n=1 Tax=Nicrophorus vespilloides TaxID=110193 RepID=A0ABM1M8X5_NICVS|nr:PREDICTED: peroxidasin homolog [Nicrophorus vespilloides]